MGRTCPHCGSSEIDDDAARGDSTCMNCGTVLEESTIVSDVTYQERAGGGSALVGRQFVSRDRAQPNNLSGVPGLLHQESREVTYMKGRKLIESIASQLRINQHCIDTAYNFFKMCVSRNFTRGRVRSHVVAACLYMTCRLENTAHLLLDFSDVTQVNVFDLGRTLNFLARSLKINLPTTDPCLYILRFAVLLEFGDKEKEVVSLATRLVQRMKRDWIATGRRPTGLCGAALVLAARCYNFNRTIGDIVRVVHISETVVRKRLDEFGKTPSSELTIDEFTTVDLEHCEDPPAFQESRRKAREQLKRKEEETLKEIEPEVVPLEEEVEKALERKRREKFKKTPYAKMMSESLVKESPELRVADLVVRNEIVDMAFDASDERQRPLAGMSSCYAPTLESLGISDPLKPQPVASKRNDEQNECGNGELDLEGIDDDEIDTYILSKEEAEMKSRLWMKLNKEHLLEMERRQRERAEEEEREKDGLAKKKRRKLSGVKKKEPIVAATVQEAMVKEKKLSNKINYEILKEIEDSEVKMVKQFYPTRSEILSSLAADVPTGQNGPAVSSLNMAPSPSKTEQDDKNEVSKLSPRRPLSRPLSTVRFRSAIRPNRPLSNTPSAQSAIKQEKQLSEGENSPKESPMDGADDKKECRGREAEASSQIQSDELIVGIFCDELVPAKATTEVILVAERTDAGLRGQEIITENEEGRGQTEQDAPARVIRSRYSKTRPSLAAAKRIGKAKAAPKPSDTAVGASRVDEPLRSAAETGAAGNLTENAGAVTSASKQSEAMLDVAFERDEKATPGTAQSLAMRTRYANARPNLRGASKRVSVDDDATPPSKKRTVESLPLSTVAEEHDLTKLETPGSPVSRNRYVEEGPDFGGVKHVTTKSEANVDVATNDSTLETESNAIPSSLLKTTGAKQQPSSICSDVSTESLTNLVKTMQPSEPNKEQDAPVIDACQQRDITPSVERKTRLRKRGAPEMLVTERSTRLTRSGARKRVTGVMGLAAMAALGRDSNASSPNVHIVHSSADTTLKPSAASNSTTITSSELSSSEVLESDALRNPDPSNNIASVPPKKVVMVGESSDGGTASKLIDASGSEATDTLISRKEQQSSSPMDVDISSSQGSKPLISEAKADTHGAVRKSTRSRYVKARPNIACASVKDQRSKTVFQEKVRF
ncbi:Transcription factor IIIB 90 kDa subunit [Toxocara canis]|uniref:B-related factor 1 n=1 Tax=Toxocara canis TaxID=6265 RepID=A0A0B2VWK4_TOXCA|nr:Transcription factor IIIB 90 kDa subunit [Toxocara canis]